VWVICFGAGSRSKQGQHKRIFGRQLPIGCGERGGAHRHSLSIRSGSTR